MKKWCMVFAMLFTTQTWIWAQYEVGIHNEEYYHKTVRDIKSPTAEGLGFKTDYNVDLFNGAPSISVPLMNVKYGFVDVPLELSYHSSGIRIDEYPTWVGLGWDLVAGGVINRKINDDPDERYNRSLGLSASEAGKDAGYYFIGKTLDKADWNSTAAIRDKFGYFPEDSMVDLEPDEFTFSFSGFSGSFFRTEKGTWMVKSKQNLHLEIEETIDYSGNYKLRNWFSLLGSDDTPFNGTNTEKVASLFTKFKITAPDGFVYIFGEDTAAIEFARGGTPLSDTDLHPKDAKANHITANTWYLTKIITPQGDTVRFEYKMARVLYKKSVSREVNVKDGTPTYFGKYFLSANANNQTFLKAIHTPNARYDFYVNKSIELGMTPVRTLSLEPEAYGETLKDLFCRHWSDLNYETANPNWDNLPNNLRKLDSIKVYNKLTDKYVYGVHFYYLQDATKRRTLDSIRFVDYELNNKDKKYAFEYNPGIPEAFESMSKDHWGLYNAEFVSTTSLSPDWTPGRVPNNFCTYGLLRRIHYPAGGYTEFEFEPALYKKYVKIDPNTAPYVTIAEESAPAIAGVRIKSITNYPKYGAAPLKKEYFYNNNYISGGTVSSGILGMKPRYIDDVVYIVNAGSAPPLNICGGTFSGRNEYDQASEWLGQYKGGIVNYSEVAVKYPDGSITVTHFSNSDQAEYRDEIHDNYVTRLGTDVSYISENHNFKITSNDLERGKILKEEYYDAYLNKVKELSYQYRNDPARKNIFARALSFRVLQSFTTTCTGSFGTMGGPRAWAYRIYGYHNPVSQVQETSYFGAQSVVTQKKFTYDTYGNLLTETSAGSDGKEYTTSYKYNSHPDYAGTASSAEAQGIKKLLTDYRIKNYLIEKNTIYKEETAPSTYKYYVTGAELYTYNTAIPTRVSRVLAFELQQPFDYMPSGTPVYNTSKIQSGNLVFDSRFRLQQSYPLYFSSGIPRTVQDVAEATALTVDNLGQYATSVTRNASNTQVAHCNFDGQYGTATDDENKGNWKFDPASVITDASAPMGSKVFELVTNSSSGSLGGPVKFLSSRYILENDKEYIISYWVKNPITSATTPVVTSLSYSYPTPALLKTTASGWNYFEGKVVGKGQAITIAIPNGGSPTGMTLKGRIDEIRLYPATSLMKSYVRDPLTGAVKEVCDETGNIRHYELDGFRRLKLSRDEASNVEQAFDYKYQETE